MTGGMSKRSRGNGQTRKRHAGISHISRAYPATRGRHLALAAISHSSAALSKPPSSIDVQDFRDSAALEPLKKVPSGNRPEWLESFWRGLSSVAVALGIGASNPGNTAGASVDPRRLAAYLKALRSQTRVLLKQLPLWERAGIGAVAGGLAGGFTNATLHPLDTVKTKLQTKGSLRMYSGPLDVIRQVGGIAWRLLEGRNLAGWNQPI